MLSGEATSTNFIVFGLTRPGLEPTIHHTRGVHNNHYTTDAVGSESEIQISSNINDVINPNKRYFIMIVMKHETANEFWFLEQKIFIVYELL